MVSHRIQVRDQLMDSSNRVIHGVFCWAHLQADSRPLPSLRSCRRAGSDLLLQAYVHFLRRSRWARLKAHTGASEGALQLVSVALCQGSGHLQTDSMQAFTVLFGRVSPDPGDKCCGGALQL
jgi:hypothetical protein